MKIILGNSLNKDLVEIIEGCAKGRREAQNALYQRYVSKMYGVCLRYSKDETEAEDILQDGFVKIFQNIDKFQNKGSFEGWIRKIMVNTALERFRKKNIMLSVGEVYETATERHYDNIESNIAAEEIMEIIQNLPLGYRTIFNLYAVEGYAHKEIAEQLSISVGTSKSQLARARATLQKEVAKLYGRSPIAMTKMNG